MIIECGHCGKEAKIKPAKAKDVNYCSQDCYWEAKKKVVQVKCDACSKLINKKPCNVRPENFCDLTCRNKFRRGANHHRYVEYENKFCSECGNAIPRGIAKRKYAKYCSWGCKLKGISGGKSRFYIHGETPYKKFSTHFKAELRAERGNKCEKCGLHGDSNKYKKNLHIHHIDGSTTNSAKENLIVLCAKCHSRTHRDERQLRGKRQEV